MVEYDDGVHLCGSVLWFDSLRDRDLCFVSHARPGRFPPHRKVLCTQSTARLAQRLLAEADTLVSPFSRPFSLGNLQIELFPSGYMLGSAQARAVHEGHSVVYAGDLGLPGARTAEKAQIRPCDTLVINCVYGDPTLPIPPRDEAEAQVVDWVQRTLDDNRTPVLLVDRVGKAQDLLKILGSSGIKTRIHRTIQEYTQIYRSCGVSFEGVKGFRGTPARDEAVLWPASLRNSPAIGRMRRPLRFGVCSGRAAWEAPLLKKRHRAQAAFPLTNHADARSLVDYVRATEAQRVFLHRGRIEAFTQALKAKGVRATPLLAPEQLSLV